MIEPRQFHPDTSPPGAFVVSVRDLPESITLLTDQQASIKRDSKQSLPIAPSYGFASLLDAPSCER